MNGDVIDSVHLPSGAGLLKMPRLRRDMNTEYVSQVIYNTYVTESRDRPDAGVELGNLCTLMQKSQNSSTSRKGVLYI